MQSHPHAGVVRLELDPRPPGTLERLAFQRFAVGSRETEAIVQINVSESAIAAAHGALPLALPLLPRFPIGVPHVVAPNALSRYRHDERRYALKQVDQVG